MRLRFSSVFLISLAFSALFPYVVFAAESTFSTPKLINYFLGYEIKIDDPAKLAKWDIVVLDMDQTYQFPERLREIKRLNPKIKLLAYVSASEISEARFRGAVGSPGARLAARIPEAWFLSRPDGSRIQWWPGNWIMNASDKCPMVDGKQWNDFLGLYIRDEIMSQGIWDGVFLDAAYDQVTYFSGAQVDINRDGLLEQRAEVDAPWRRGMTELITKVRKANPNILIMNNSSSAYAGLTNGTLFENFSSRSSAQVFTDFRASLAKNAAPKISAINSNTANIENPTDYRSMRFGLTSALIGDGFYSFDAGDAGHFRTWWYDEYDAQIGTPKGSAKHVGNGVWIREYTNGYVLVNQTKNTEIISLPGEFERVLGIQDVTVNSGSLMNKATVPFEDGVVLLRRNTAASVHGTSYINGSFLQVVNASGQIVRNGFFASRDDVPFGASVLQEDLDRDGIDDVVFSDAGLVTVSLSAGGISSFYPYGTGYKGGIELSAGQVNQTPALELVLVPTLGIAPTVIVTDLRGKALQSWLAFPKERTEGASILIRDLDGDGKNEIMANVRRGNMIESRTFALDEGIAMSSPDETRYVSVNAFNTSEPEISVRYYAATGDQLGIGPLPPRVGESTRYWVRLSSEAFRAHLVLGKNVRFTGRKAANNIFEIELTPDASQKGSVPVLIESAAGIDTNIPNDQIGKGNGKVR